MGLEAALQTASQTCLPLPLTQAWRRRAMITGCAGMVPPELKSSIERCCPEFVPCAGISKAASVKTFHHSFAAHLPEQSSNDRTTQELLGHSDVKAASL